MVFVADDVDQMLGQQARNFTAKPQQFADRVQARALALAAQSDRPDDTKGVALTPLARRIADNEYAYEYVTATIDARTRTAWKSGSRGTKRTISASASSPR